MNPNHHRRSIRLKGYDYTRDGAYFITLVTYQRAEVFGAVVDGQVVLSALGQIVHDEWMRSIELRREIQLFEDEFVIMPTHIHGIVHINTTDERHFDIVGAHGMRPDGEGEGARRAPQQATQQAPQPAGQPKRAPKSLGSFIAGYKSAVTSRARRELGLTDIWQRNYYEHIIRNAQEFARIWNYIDTNPQKWEADQLQPKA